MAKHTYHGHLRQVPMFANLTERELDAVSSLTTHLDYEAGKVLMTQGGLGHELFILISGKAVVVRDDEQIAELGPGSFAGELALLTQRHRTSTVTVTENASVLVVDGREFYSILHNVPEIAVKMLPIIAQRVVKDPTSDSH